MKTKNWTEDEEITLEHLYAYDWSYSDLAKRFNCTITEIKRKVKEMGIWQ